MNYSSAHRIASKTCPGVAFVLKRTKTSVRRRQAIEDIKAPFLDRMRPLREALEPLDAEYRVAIEAAELVGKADRDELIAKGATVKEARQQVPRGTIEFADEKFREWSRLSQEIGRIDRDEMTPAVVCAMLSRIEGLEVEDPARPGEDPPVTIPGTIDLVFEHGPDELYEEIAVEVARELGLIAEEKSNLSSPFTSPAAVEGTGTLGSADLAGMPATTSSADAPSSTALASAIAPSMPSPQ